MGTHHYERIELGTCFCPRKYGKDDGTVSAMITPCYWGLESGPFLLVLKQGRGHVEEGTVRRLQGRHLRVPSAGSQQQRDGLSSTEVRKIILSTIM
jgi:hypothetical protein